MRACAATPSPSHNAPGINAMVEVRWIALLELEESEDWNFLNFTEDDVSNGDSNIKIDVGTGRFDHR